MPIYEYQCQACGHTLDALQKISEPPLTDCPSCGEAALRKLISAPLFRLKGGGWYETDFKSENRRNLADAPGEKEAKSAGDDKGAGDTAKKDSAKKAESGGDGNAKPAKGEAKSASSGTGKAGKPDAPASGASG